MADLQEFEHSFLGQFSSIDTEKVCLALSGGLDSMVLLHLMHVHLNGKYKIRAIHVNHNLNENSNDWSIFCKKQCSQLGIDLTVESIRPENNGSGLEASARDERYRVIKENLTQNELLLTAHHKDDQLETILFRIFRGTGINGLRGIVHYRDDNSHNILRPLLKYSRADLEEYASANNIKWIKDDSNDNISFDRNY
ncbi:MAG: tRNA lysidine(34) synthetase TilS, partial [Pseudomonadota bacterium]|nr:tRNA lysidine(34) synthetase TilS [Pseudomonadota bacterium]